MTDLSNKPISWTGMHPLGAMYRAALARAEAAEAKAAVLDTAFTNSNALNEQLGNENRRLAARVAELEAYLGGDIQAMTPDGQQHRIQHGNWRPLPPPAADEVQP